ncbi:methyl-accepting chemotaxis protein [Haloarcula laminariae]|uniref:methyl-accepting chemotaxis protein n=1 Tax=Haloarcula laminariae TaxID=2961577 RepID=UPI0032AE8FBE
MSSIESDRAQTPERPDDAEIGTWEYTPPSGTFRWSAEANRIHGPETGQTGPLSDVLGQFDSETLSLLREDIERAANAGEPFTREIRLADDQQATLRLHGAPVREEGDIVAVRGIAQDSTELSMLRQRVEVLRDASQQLMGAESPETVAQIMADASKNILGYVNTTIRLLDEEEGMLRTTISTEECVSKAGERPDYPVDEATPAARTFRTGESELQQDHEATQDGRDRGELMSGLYVPIGDQGVLSAGDTAISAFDDGDLEAAELLGQLGSEALTRIESQRELQEHNEQLTGFIQEMTASIEEVTTTTNTVETLAAEAVEKANEGDDAIDSVADEVDEIESQVEAAAADIEQLNEVVTEIDEIVNLIHEIADQTNILALNANIEAARAGEAGAGFAVVADEVKALAERTQEATDEIESLIQRVEQQTAQTTESIRASTGYVADGRASAHTSSELLNEVVTAIGETKDGVAEIHQAMEEQSDSIERISATLDE